MLLGRVIPFSEPGDPHSQAPGRPQMVVQIGRDPELLRLRARIISSAGYTVYSMTPEEATSEIRKTRAAQVWVFCHTLEFYELALLAVAVRNSRPEDKLLRLIGLNDTRLAPGLFDEFFEPVNGVDDLLQVVAELSKQPS
jgi:hypothetical protein